MPTKPSHIQQEVQDESVIGHPDYPISHHSGHTAPGHGISDKRPTKKLSRTKSGGKRSKEKVRETGSSTQPYENPINSSVSRETAPFIQQHENPTYTFDATVDQDAAWFENQQAPQQDAAVQPIEDRSWQQDHQPQNPAQPVEENRRQPQNEGQLDEHLWQEQQNAMQPANEGHWLQQNQAEIDENHWQEPHTMKQANGQFWQHQTEVQPPNEQRRQGLQSATPPDGQARQNQQQTNDEATLHQPGMVDEAGDSLGEPQLHSHSTQFRQPDFEVNNGQAMVEHHAVDNNVTPAQHFYHPSSHGNSKQPMPIATGIKKVTKKKKKKKKSKSKPALDYNTLPQEIFGIPFDQLGQVHAAENRHREPNQDQQQGPIPEPSVSDRVRGENFQGSHVAPDLSGQHNSEPVVDINEEVMDVDQHDQVQETQHASPAVVDSAPAKFSSAPHPTALKQTSHRRQSDGTNPREGHPERHTLPQVAAAPEEYTGHEHHTHQERHRQELIANSCKRGPQHNAQHRPQVKPVLVNNQAPQDTRTQGLPCHSEGGTELRRDPQHHAPRHVNEPVLQGIDPKQNRLGQDSEIVNHRRSSKHQAPGQVDAEELPEIDEHVSHSLHAQQNHREQTTDINEHQPVELTQHHVSHRPQPLVARFDMSGPHHIYTPGYDRAQPPIHEPDHQQQVQTHAEPSQSVQQTPVMVNIQPATHRQGAPAAVGRTKLNPRRSSRQQIVTPPATELISPVIDAPTNATNGTKSNPGTEACSAQVDPVSGAFAVLQLTLRQDLQATIAKENEARRALQSEIAELKVSEARLQAEVNIITASKNELIETSTKDREKLKANSEKLAKLQKFIGGINNDLTKEKQNARALHQQITELVNEGKASATERTQIHEQLTKAIETSKAVQSKWAKELTNTKLLIQKFELEKTSLEKDLREKNQLLEDERDQRSRLADDIHFQAIDQQFMKQLINETSTSLLQKLSELQLTVINSKDTVTSQGVADLLELVKALESRNAVSPDDLTGLKEQIDNFQNR